MLLQMHCRNISFFQVCVLLWCVWHSEKNDLHSQLIAFDHAVAHTLLPQRHDFTAILLMSMCLKLPDYFLDDSGQRTQTIYKIISGSRLAADICLAFFEFPIIFSLIRSLRCYQYYDIDSFLGPVLCKVHITNVFWQ